MWKCTAVRLLIRLRFMHCVHDLREHLPSSLSFLSLHAMLYVVLPGLTRSCGQQYSCKTGIALCDIGAQIEGKLTSPLWPVGGLLLDPVRGHAALRSDVIWLS